MKLALKIVVTIALLAMAGTIGSVGAQQASPQESQWGGPGYMMGQWMMGPWMMGDRGMMGYGHMSPWMMGQSGQSAAMCAAMGSHIEGRLAYIKTELKITEAQESLWNAYAGAARDNAQAMSAHCNATIANGGSNTASLPDRLDQHIQFMAAQLDALRSMSKALKPLYAALSDTQKQATSQLYWGPMGMM